MATTRLMATVLPYSVDPQDKFHVSVFISHRLEGGSKLSDFAAMLNWVKTLKQNATFTLRSAEAGATAIPCRPLLEKASETAWETAFPPGTGVADYPEPKPSSADWNSFPANRMPDHALDVHHASALSSPIDRPRVDGNPFAGGVLKAFGGADTAGGAIANLQGYKRDQANRRKNLPIERQSAARRAVEPERPKPDLPSGPAIGAPPAIAAPDEHSPWRSPIEMLLDRADENAIDAAITALLDFYVNEPTQIPDDDAILAMLVDLHRAQRYYNRPEEQGPPDPDNDGLARIPRIAHETPDFHERAGAACNVPALARALGFVVDVKVDDLEALKQATRIWCDVTVNGMANVEKYVSPETLCVVEGTRFLAVPADSNLWASGRLRLGDPLRYRVMDLDPDAGALSLEQLCRGAVRALATELNGDSGSFAPAGLRATGFAVAELSRPNRLHRQIKKSEALRPVVEQPGTVPTRERFNFEGLLRGTRLEVWDDVTRRWHSLHERLVTASFVDKPILNAVEDAGLLQHPPLSRAPGEDDNPYYVHEVLAGWDGWSLSAPRPGKQVIHNDASHPEPGRERLDDTPESTAEPGLWVRSTVKPKTLPALRYGRKYSFRIAGVDLAGNSVPMAQTSPDTVAESLIDMATTHLDELRAEASTREQSGVLAALRPELDPAAPGGTGRRGEIQRATAAVVAKASSLRRYPQFDDVEIATSRRCSPTPPIPTWSPSPDSSCAGTRSRRPPWCPARSTAPASPSSGW